MPAEAPFLPAETRDLTGGPREMLHPLLASEKTGRLAPLCPTWSQPCLPLNSSFLHAEAGVHSGLGGVMKSLRLFIVLLRGGKRGANAPESIGKK